MFPDVDYSYYDLLSTTEKELYNSLLTKSDINLGTIKHITQLNNNEIINRFNVIKGEILIGNDNPTLLKELKLIMLKLMDLKILDRHLINKILMELFLLNI